MAQQTSPFQRRPSPVEYYSLSSHSVAASQELRMDAGHYNPELLDALGLLRESGMRLECLEDVAERVFIPPRFKRVYVEPEHGLPFLQGSHIVHFQPADIKYLSPSSHPRIQQWIVHAGWVLVTCSGTIGRTTICPEEWDGWPASQHILRIIPDEGTCPAGYLCSFLASPLGQVQLTASTYGAVVDELTEEQAQAILVPLPNTKKDWNRLQSVDTLAKKAVELKSEAVASAETSVGQLVERFGIGGVM